MSRFIQIMNIYSMVNGVLSIIFNSALLCLVIKCKNTMLGFYRKLLSIYVIITLIGSVINTFFGILISVSESGFVVYASALQSYKIGQMWGSSVIVIFCWEIIGLLLVLAVSYFYRYCTICRPRWKVFSSRTGLVLVSVGAIFIFLLYGACALWMQPDHYKNKTLGPNFKRHFGVSIANASYIGMVSYKNDSIGFEFVAVAGIRGSSFVLLSMIIAFFGLSIFLKLRRNFSKLANLSTSSKITERQHRLFCLLFMQTLVPVSCVYIPLACGLLMSALRIRIFLICDMISVLLPLSQLLDPIIVFCCVNDYRKTTFNWVKSLSVEYRSKTDRPTVTNNEEPREQELVERRKTVNKDDIM